MGQGFTAMFFSSILFLTEVWQYSILRAGFAVAPGPALVAVLAPFMGTLAGRIGQRPLLLIGGVAFAVGGLWRLVALGGLGVAVVGQDQGHPTREGLGQGARALLFVEAYEQVDRLLTRPAEDVDAGVTPFDRVAADQRVGPRNQPDLDADAIEPGDVVVLDRRPRGSEDADGRLRGAFDPIAPHDRPFACVEQRDVWAS